MHSNSQSTYALCVCARFHVFAFVCMYSTYVRVRCVHILCTAERCPCMWLGRDFHVRIRRHASAYHATPAQLRAFVYGHLRLPLRVCVSMRDFVKTRSNTATFVMQTHFVLEDFQDVL